jgi:hypothetical protein
MLLALLLLQDTVHIPRNDDRKPVYETLLKRYAEIRLDDPRRAIEALDALIAGLGDGPVECRIRVERMANVYGDPVDFLPYQLRGRARLALGGRAALLAAERDFEASIGRKATSSAAFLARTRSALWEDVRPDTGVDRWTPEALEIARRLKPDWAVEEARRAGAELDALSGTHEDKHAPARRALGWAEAVGAEELRDKAKALLAKRTRFRLQIVVAPYAELTRVVRDGKDVELDTRHTPLVLTLEAAVYEFELTHPKIGSRRARIRPSDVEDGRSYVLGGDLEAGGPSLSALKR